MKKRTTQLFAFAVLTVAVAPQAIFANYPANSSYRQAQAYSNDQNHPNISEERSFTQDARNQYNHLRQENHNMYTQDRQMTQEGYDPNESRGSAYSNRYMQEQAGKQQQFGRQEQLMRGNYQNQNNYGSDTAIPQSYSIGDSPYQNVPQHNGHEHHPVYEYMLGKDGKWHQTTGNADHSRDNTQDDSDKDQDTDKRVSYSSTRSNPNWNTTKQDSSASSTFKSKQTHPQ